MPPDMGTYILISYQRSQNRKRLLCIEHLDYPTSQTRGMIGKLPKDYRGITNEFILVDGRDKSPKEKVLAVERKMRDAKDRINDGSDPNDYSPMYGGIATVPMVVMAGFCWGNQNSILLRDYDRSLGSWHDNGNVDDGMLISSTPLPDASVGNHEVGLCLEFSMAMDRSDMSLRFPDVSIFTLNYADGKTGLDRLSSEHKQQRFIREVVDYMNGLIKRFPNLTVLNLFITAQSSFVFRVGQALHQNHIPAVRIHHFDAKSPLGQRHVWSLEISGPDSFNIL